MPTVIAETNWWGDASGPTHSGNPAGTGDAVTDGADYDPWNAESSVTADGCQPVALPGSTTWFLGLLAALFVGLLALRCGRSVRPA